MPFSSHQKGEWLPDGQREIPVQRLPNGGKKDRREEIRSSTEQVSRKLKYLYADHNARPHTVMKRLLGRQCERELASILCLWPTPTESREIPSEDTQQFQ